MKLPFLTTGLLGLTVLTACGDGTPFADDSVPAVGSATLNTDTYVVSQEGVEILLDAAEAAPFNGLRAWITTPDRAIGYETDFALAIGGIAEDGTPFAGVSGTDRAAPTGDAVFVGNYGVVSGTDGYETGALTLTFNVLTDALTNDEGDLTVDAILTDDGFAGTVEFEGESANLRGDFYGTDEVAGAFTGDTIAGVISGVEE